MYCNKCGRANPNDGSFCSQCGLPLQHATGPVIAAASAATSVQAQAATAPNVRRVGVFDEEAWRAVTGKNQDYYLPRFKAMIAGGAAPRWHWSSFFVTWYWMLHRKMWGLSVLYFIAPYVLGILLGVGVGVVGSMGVDTKTAASVGTSLLFVLLFIGPPMFANAWYFRHCQKTMDKAREQTSSREGYIGFLAGKGGTGGAAVVIFIFVAIAVIGILAAVALPAYQDYTQRAKVNAAIGMARKTANAVVDHYGRTGRIPERLEDIPGAPTKSPEIGEVSINPKTGEVSVQVKGVGHVNIRPRVNGNTMTLECWSPDIRPAWRPQTCR